MTNETIKGFKDYTGEDAVKRAEVKKILVRTFESYGFEPAETPIVEAEEFVRGENTKKKKKFLLKFLKCYGLEPKKPRVGEGEGFAGEKNKNDGAVSDIFKL